MSPEAFAAVLLAYKGKGSITLYMKGVDPEDGLDIDPDATIPAADHPEFRQLADVPDADSLWIATDGPSSLGVGPIRVNIGQSTTLIDIRQISAIEFD